MKHDDNCFSSIEINGLVKAPRPHGRVLAPKLNFLLTHMPCWGRGKIRLLTQGLKDNARTEIRQKLQAVRQVSSAIVERQIKKGEVESKARPIARHDSLLPSHFLLMVSACNLFNRIYRFDSFAKRFPPEAKNPFGRVAVKLYRASSFFFLDSFIHRVF